jgi:serine/threonine-protein kinase
MTANFRKTAGRDLTGDRSKFAGPRDGQDGSVLRVGPYHLIRRLGKGGQGEVWRAIGLDPSVEVVALKVLRPSGRRDPPGVARFRHEAERGAALDARGVLPIYEFGHEGEVAFFAMPLVEGSTLAQVLYQRRRHRAGEAPSRWHRVALLPELPYFEAVALILAQVAHAVADAHAARVVHCDVKPANILLERGSGGAYLIDFGMGRDLDAMPASRHKTLEGTVLYMAPEKLSGRRAVEVLCDIYALGATGFEAVSLRLPRALPESVPRP